MDDKNQMSAALKKTLYISKILNGLLIVCFVVTGCNFQWVKDLSVERTSTSVNNANVDLEITWAYRCLLYTSPSPRDRTRSRMPSSA
mgnify:CR=1 FL=1